MTYRGERHGDREGHYVDPAPPLRQAVPGEQRARQHQHDEHGVDDARGVRLSGDGSGSGDVDHRVEGGENQHPYGLGALAPGRGNGLGPDLSPQLRGPGQLRLRPRDVREASIHREPRIDVLPELLPDLGYTESRGHGHPTR